MGDGNLAAYVAIVAMALVTYATRASGPALVRRLPRSARMDGALGAVPGAVLMAIVAPAVVAAGPAGWAGAVIVLLVTARTGQVLLGIAAGILVVGVASGLGW